MILRTLRLVAFAAFVCLAIPKLCLAEYSPMPFLELVRHADVILVGRTTKVESIEPLPWDGRWKARLKAVIQVEQLLKGQVPSEKVEVLYGIDFICDITYFKEGTQYVLFLKREEIDGRVYYKLANYDSAQFWVKDGMVVTPRWEWPEPDLESIPLQRFIGEIRQLLGQQEREDPLLEKSMAVRFEVEEPLFAAQNRALELGHRPENSAIKVVDKAADPSLVDSFLEAHPDLGPRLNEGQYVIFHFSPKALQLGGDLFLFVDFESGTVLGELRGE